MVARQFIVSHKDSVFDVDYDTEDGLEVSLALSKTQFSRFLSTVVFVWLLWLILQVFKIQLFSLTSIPPHLQQVFVVLFASSSTLACVLFFLSVFFL